MARAREDLVAAFEARLHRRTRGAWPSGPVLGWLVVRNGSQDLTDLPFDNLRRVLNRLAQSAPCPDRGPPFLQRHTPPPEADDGACATAATRRSQE